MFRFKAMATATPSGHFFASQLARFSVPLLPLLRTTRLELPSAQARTQSLPSKLQQREPLKLRPASRFFKLINLILKFRSFTSCCYNTVESSSRVENNDLHIIYKPSLQMVAWLGIEPGPDPIKIFSA